MVPKDHPDSNYLLAYNEFLSKVLISFTEVHIFVFYGCGNVPFWNNSLRE